MDLTTVVGIAASVLTGASLLPQLIKILREKKPQDISFLMLTILLGGVSLWVWYGVLRSDWIIVVSNSVSALLNMSIFALSFYYGRRDGGQADNAKVSSTPVEGVDPPAHNIPSG